MNTLFLKVFCNLFFKLLYFTIFIIVIDMTKSHRIVITTCMLYNVHYEILHVYYEYVFFKYVLSHVYNVYAFCGMYI